MRSPGPETILELQRVADQDPIAGPEPDLPATSLMGGDAASGCGFAFATNRPNITRAGPLGSWYLPVGQTISSVCGNLNQRHVNYVVLPSAVGEGAALLIADEYIPQIKDVISCVPLGRRLAVYATTDLPGFSFQQHWRYITDATNMAVLPPYLAEALLARGRIDELGLRVPPPQDLLLWAIYCALFLGGDTYFAISSSNDRAPILVGRPAKMIGDLARKTAADLSQPFRLSALHEHLANAGWEPPYDVLKRLSSWNSWAAFKVHESEASAPAEEPGVVAFFIRRQVLASGLEEDLMHMLEVSGFELLKTIDLDEHQAAAAARATRGANWGPGGYPVSGGPPARVVIALDLLPLPVPAELRRNYPFLDNERALRAKQFSRQLIRERLPRPAQFNPLHSTDASSDAWKIVRMFAPDEEQALRQTIESRRSAFATDFDVVRNLTRTGVRAKIELIRYRGGLAVKKTYRQTCLRFMDREAALMDAVSPHRPEILPVLERGANYLIMPFVEGRPLRRLFLGVGIPKLMPLRQVRQVADLLRYMFSRGYDPVDLAPHNLLVDRSGKLTAIDFEFVHRSDGPIEPERSACLNGIPDGFEGDWPLRARWNPKKSKTRIDPYRLRWLGHTGLSRESFLHDPPAIQYLKRMANYPTYLCTKAVEREVQWLRHRTKQMLRNRLPVITRMAARALRSRAIRT